METNEFTNMLKKASNINEFIDTYKEEFEGNAFLEYANHLLIAKETYHSEVARRSGLSDSYVNQLFNGTKDKPQRKALIKLAFGLKLTLDETNRLLMLCKHSMLRSKVKRESIIIFCINLGYDVYTADEILYSHNEDLLNNH